MFGRYFLGRAVFDRFDDLFGVVGLTDFLAGLALTATGGVADECFGRVALAPLLTWALSSSAALGMAATIVLAQQNTAATMAPVTLRVLVCIGTFLFCFTQNNWTAAPGIDNRGFAASNLFLALYFPSCYFAGNVAEAGGVPLSLRSAYGTLRLLA